MTSNRQTLLSLAFATTLAAAAGPASKAFGEDHAGATPTRSAAIRRTDLLNIFRQLGDAAFERFRNYGEERLDALRQSFDVIQQSFSSQKASELIEAFKPGAEASPQVARLDDLMRETRRRWSAISAHAREYERTGMTRDAAFKKALRFAASADKANALYGATVDQFAEGLLMDPEDLLDELARLEKTPPRTEAERTRLLGLLVAHRFYLANGGAELSKKAHISQRAAVLLLHGSKGSAEVKADAKVLLAKLPELSPSERKDVLEQLALSIKFGEATNRVLYGDADPGRLPGNKYGNALLIAHAVRIFSEDPAQRSLLERGKTDQATRDKLLKVVEEFAEDPLPEAPRDNRVDPRTIAEGSKHLRDNVALGIARVRERRHRGAGPQGQRALLDADRAFDDALDAVDDRRSTQDGRRLRERSESDLFVGVPEWLCALAVARASQGSEPSEALRRDCAREFAEAGIQLPPLNDTRVAGGNRPVPGNVSGTPAGGNFRPGEGSTVPPAGTVGSLPRGNGSSVMNRPATTSDDATDADRLDGAARSLFSRRSSTPASPPSVAQTAPPKAAAPPTSAPEQAFPAAAPARTSAPDSSSVAAANPSSTEGHVSIAPVRREAPTAKASQDNSHSETNALDDVPTLADSASNAHDARRTIGDTSIANDDDGVISRRGVAALSPRDVRPDGGVPSSPGNFAGPAVAATANTTGGAGTAPALTGAMTTTWFAPSFALSAPVDSTSSVGDGGKKTPVGMLASEENGWAPGMMPPPGTLTMPRPLYAPERGKNLLWRDRSGFTPRPGEEALRFDATDWRRSPLAAGRLELPGTAPIALNELGPARETIFARRGDLLLGQAEFLVGREDGKLPDGRKVEILRVAEVDPGVREDDPKSLLGRTVKRRTIVKLVEKDGTTKTFTTTFDEQYVPGPDGKPLAVKLAERIDVLEESKDRAPVRRRIERKFALDRAGRPVQVATNEMLVGRNGQPLKVRDDKVVLQSGSAPRRSTTFYDVDDWKKRVFELDQELGR